MNLAAFTRLMRPLEVRTPRGATKIAPPQVISGMIPRFLLDDVGPLVSFPLDPVTDPAAAVDKVGVQSKHRARQFVTKL